MFLLRVVALSPRNSHALLPQDVADTALGDGLLELVFKEGSQFLLGEGRVLSLLLPQPDLSLRCHFVRVTMPVINERFPEGASLAIATAEVRKRPPAEGKAQLLAEVLELLSPVEAVEDLLLGQSSSNLTGSVALHEIPPETEIAL